MPAFCAAADVVGIAVVFFGHCYRRIWQHCCEFSSDRRKVPER
jgi:hypothetical protein